MKKKVLATLLTAAMLATTLAGCGGGDAGSAPAADGGAAEEAPAADAQPWARRGSPASVRGPVPSSRTGGEEARPHPAGGGTGRLSGPAWGNNNFS